MARRSSAGARLALVVLLAVAVGCGDDDAEPDAPGREAADRAVERFDPKLAAFLPPGIEPELAEEGRELFVVCATCHGPDARGTQLAPSLRDAEWIHGSGTFEEIQALTREGIAEPEEYPIPMPPGGAGEFDDRELRAVSAYVFALGRSGAAPPSQ